MLMMLVRLGTVPADTQSQRPGGLLLVMLGTGPADGHDAGEAGDWPS